MLKKRYLKSGPVKVEFVLPDVVAQTAETVFLVGDFNNWDEQATPMKQLKGGSFKVTLDLEPDRDYQFRYLVNGTAWHNDWDADAYVPNPFSGDNSVVKTHHTDA
ncbi:MAG: isoamylase early set domain-containing protein [Anaerolineaceae bacterium]|jgi:1,4-alpha-glucan branching enzyme|uniref:isoamylase early set domain-containing protein n=1 Tax=Aggregatilinea sp. TaxID=2806333 RepID=UPI002B52FF50|nr:isoamylase early set domain-containing protein [Aggregatilinea sp.]HML21749.1 isoamylase early set domain-containing protein [Aggregatilinea sp.]